MTARGATTHDKRLQQVAEDYRQRGYRVTITPSESQLPEFLRAYKPEVLAESSDESVVVEIGPAGKGPEDRNWGELAELVQQHPGWRLDLVVDKKRSQDTPAVIHRQEIEARLQEGIQLSEASMLEAALLITWSASEAAMRLVSQKQKVDLPDARPATIISRLYSDGVIGHDEYDLLIDYMHIRNSVAHGLRHASLDPEMIRRLYDLTLGLLRSA